MKRAVWMVLLCFGGASAVVGCGAEPEEPLGFEEEEEEEVEGDEEEDVVTIGDLDDDGDLDLRCDGAIIDEWPLNDAVSTGGVTANQEGGVFEAQIDGSAGGMQGATSNPFTYLNLQTGEKVEITDLESLENEEWDLAFKRVVIRTNSGDSGPGGALLARLVDTSLEEVEAAPDMTTPHHQDDTFDSDCEVRVDSIGNPYTAFNYLNPMSPSNSWYDYGSGGATGVSPIEGDVYVLRRDDRDEIYKLEILSWDSGVITIRWAQIEE